MEEFNKDYLLRHQDSVPHLVTGGVHITDYCSHVINCVLSAGATVLYRLHPECRDEAISLITNLNYPSRNLKVINVQDLFLLLFCKHLQLSCSLLNVQDILLFATVTGRCLRQFIFSQNEVVIENRLHTMSHFTI